MQQTDEALSKYHKNKTPSKKEWKFLNIKYK